MSVALLQSLVTCVPPVRLSGPYFPQFAFAPCPGSALIARVQSLELRQRVTGRCRCCSVNDMFEYRRERKETSFRSLCTVLS